MAVFLNPANGPRNTNLQLVQEAARVIGLQIHILNASTSGEIDAAFASLARERPDALFVVPDQFSVRGPSRRDRRVVAQCRASASRGGAGTTSGIMLRGA